MDIIKKLAQELRLREEQAKTVQLIDEGNTIPLLPDIVKRRQEPHDERDLRNLHERLLSSQFRRKERAGN